MFKYIKIFVVMVITLSLSAFAPEADDAKVEAEKAAVTKVADDLSAAIHASDADTVKRLLAEDVKILESGHAQKSRDEYMGGHMLSDMKFLSTLKSTINDRQVSVAGDLAWVITHSQMTGEYKDRKIDRASREMLVMKHDGHDWKITLIHWGYK